MPLHTVEKMALPHALIFFSQCTDGRTASGYSFSLELMKNEKDFSSLSAISVLSTYYVFWMYVITKFFFAKNIYQLLLNKIDS